MGSSMEEMNINGDGGGEVTLPGFRFHPTEEELLDFYLKNMVAGKKLRYDVIGKLNIYHHDPWDLPGLAKVGEREWYFFVPRDKKHGTGGRPNRTTEKGFWKATGSDRKIVTLSDPKRIIGLRKTLVFYEGRAPRGSKTDWVMNEYRLPDTCPLPKDIVLCKIYRKATSLKVLEQRAALEEEMKQMDGSPDSTPSSNDTMSFTSQNDDKPNIMPFSQRHVVLKTEIETEPEEEQQQEQMMLSVPLQVPKHENDAAMTQLPLKDSSNKTTIQLPFGKDKIPELQMPMMITDLGQDNAIWAQLNSPWNSPWMQNLAAYPNIINF